MEWRDWEDKILSESRFFNNKEVSEFLLPHRTPDAVRVRRKAKGVEHQVRCKKCSTPIKKTNRYDICKHCTSSRNTDISYRYAEYQRDARKRNHTWDLTLNEFVTHWNSHCSYCNGKIHGIGLDRVDNSIGYTAKNVVPCCKVCNKIKGAMPLNDWLEAITRIVKHGSRNDKCGSG